MTARPLWLSVAASALIAGACGSAAKLAPGADAEIALEADAATTAPPSVDARAASADAATSADLAAPADPGRDAGNPEDALTTDDAGGRPETIHFVGRWDLRKAGRAITVNSGSHIIAQWDGPAISARFDLTLNRTPIPTIAWRVDGGAWSEAFLSATVPLASGLAAGRHEIMLMARGMDEMQSRWSPPLVASITFLGLDAPGGGLVPSLRPRKPRLEFLGDSITEGVQIWTDKPGQMGPTWNVDGRTAYPCQTSLALDAEWRQVGFGRQGILIAGNGGVPVAPAAFNWIYEGAPRDDWQPDVVVINQGTNDRRDQTPGFSPAFGKYLDIVRTAYKNAWMVVMVPFVATGHPTEVKAEVATRKAAGDNKLLLVDTQGWLKTSDLGADGVHPNAAGSVVIRDHLLPVLRPLLPAR